MQRVTITIDDELAAELDRFMAAYGYANRSEAVRDLSRSGLQQAARGHPDVRACIAALIYVYDHAKRELAQRLTRDYHERHDLARATLHVHLDQRAASRSRCSRAVAPRCRNLPTTSSPSAACVTGRWSTCRPTACIPTAAAARTATAMVIRDVRELRRTREAARRAPLASFAGRQSEAIDCKP